MTALQVATIVCNNSSSVKRFAENCMVTSKLRQIGNLNFCDPHKIWGKNVKQDHDYSILTGSCGKSNFPRFVGNLNWLINFEADWSEVVNTKTDTGIVSFDCESVENWDKNYY